MKKSKWLILSFILITTSIAYASSEVKIIDNKTSGYKADVFKQGTVYGLGVDVIPANIIINGQKTVTTAGTQLPITASSTSVRSVCIKALHANTNMVYVGKSTVSSSDGYVLDAGESVCMEVNDLNTIYIDTDTNGEGVSYLAIN